MNYITDVEKGSIAEELGIETGDILLLLNNCEVKDIFDYRYNILDEYVELLIKKPNGEEWELEIEKDENEDIGIVFENALLDKAKSCQNKCIFCFVDQMPKGMRETLYFKDDDTRLSFLQGNYVTLTNMSDDDIDRIIYYHLSPINISVHAIDSNVRQFMLKNPKSGKVLDYIKKLADAKIQMNYQIVLCKDVNDGDILDQTIKSLSEFMPSAISLSVVPVGITKFRDDLHGLQQFTTEDYKNVLDKIHMWQDKLSQKYNNRFVFASDEFYLNANVAIPQSECYEDFPQIENGVGMVRSFYDEFMEALDKLPNKSINKEISVVTGTLVESVIKSLVEKLNNKFPNIKVNVYAIKNKFFGETITVSGLLTARDIIDQLIGHSLGDYIIIPENALRRDDVVFLDNYTLDDMKSALNINVVVSKVDGSDFLSKIIGDIK